MKASEVVALIGMNIEKHGDLEILVPGIDEYGNWVANEFFSGNCLEVRKFEDDGCPIGAEEEMKDGQEYFLILCP